MTGRLRLAVHKFSSCDGCQLALLNLGEALLGLPRRIEILHFAEAGPLAPEAEVDLALVEGSLSTPEDLERIRGIRERSAFLVTIGACATSGGLQALRNLLDDGSWMGAVYARPDYLQSLSRITAVAEAVHVDLELWGCPVNSRQVLAVLGDLLRGVTPAQEQRPLCMECKRLQRVCTLVTRGAPCMGPVTRAGCGALCPHFGRACYACYGPAEQVNGEAMGRRLQGLGLVPEAVARRFHFIHSGAPAFREAGRRFAEDGGEGEP